MPKWLESENNEENIDLTAMMTMTTMTTMTTTITIIIMIIKMMILTDYDNDDDYDDDYNNYDYDDDYADDEDRQKAADDRYRSLCYLEPLVNAPGVKLMATRQNTQDLVTVKVTHTDNTQGLIRIRAFGTGAEAVRWQLVNVAFRHTTWLTKALSKIQKSLRIHNMNQNYTCNLMEICVFVTAG